MKTTLSFLAIFLLSNLAIAQITLIPDTNFEKALIDLGYDSGVPDGGIPTSNISYITSLNVFNKNIGDLTGIEDFTILQELLCDKNQLTTLNISQNTGLIKLELSPLLRDKS